MNDANPPDEQRPASDQDWIVELVEASRTGDQTAFHRLVDHFQPEIFRMLYYRTRSRPDAEDLTQDVFLRAFKHLARLQSPQVFRSWLYRIAVNRVNDHFRKKRFRALFGGPSIDDETFLETEEMAVPAQAPEALARKEFWKQVENMLDALSNTEREVFLLRFFDQLSIKEITAALGKNESTVKTHLYRSLKKIKDSFGDMRELLEALC
jgi:RNA polymerase sigma-70 factor (ECF subfamily)